MSEATGISRKTEDFLESFAREKNTPRQAGNFVLLFSRDSRDAAMTGSKP